MAYKQVRRTFDANLWTVERRGTDGIAIEISHTSQGSKHTTHYRDTFNLSFCDMKRMGSKFHTIMDELHNEWRSTKKAISGER